MPRKGDEICPYCGKLSWSKDRLAREIMKLIGIKKESIYCQGNFSKTEMNAIYHHLKSKKL